MPSAEDIKENFWEFLAAIGAIGLTVVIMILSVIGFFISLILWPMLGVVSDWFDGLVNKTFIPMMSFFIAANPNVFAFEPLVEDMVKILATFYIVAIGVTGVYIIFISSSPANRARAKTMMLRLIFGMLAVSLSIPIFSIFLDVSYGLTQKLLVGTYSSGGVYFAFTQPILWVVGIFVVPLITLLALITIGARYVLVSLMAVLFPLTLFLYFFELTRGLGSKLLRYTFMAIFSQPVMALMLFITFASFNSVGVIWESGSLIGAIVGLMIGLGGFLMIAFAPLMMLGLMEWVGGAVAAAGMTLAYERPMLGGALVGLGGIGAGMGPEALVVGYSVRAMGMHKAEQTANAERQFNFMLQERVKGRITNADDAARIVEDITHYGHEYWETDIVEPTMGKGPKAVERHMTWEERELKASIDTALGEGRSSIHTHHYPHPIDAERPEAATRIDREIVMGKRMLPYPLYAVTEVVDKTRGLVSGRGFRGMSRIRQLRKFNTKIESCATIKDIANETSNILIENGLSAEAGSWWSKVDAAPNLEHARERARAAVVYGHLRNDPKFSSLPKAFFDGLQRDIGTGDTKALDMPNVVKHLRETGTTMGWTPRQTERVVNRYVQRHKYYYNRYGAERGGVCSIIGSYRDAVAIQLESMTPADRDYYMQLYEDFGPLAFRLDLGSNLHARMLLEDYMGIGPRPSEFYHGIGPESVKEWEKMRKKEEEIREGDSDTWEKI